MEAAFECQQPSLAVDACSVAGEGAVGADDTVAGNDDDDAVGSVCRSDGAHSSRCAHGLGLLPVRTGLAERDLQERIPRCSLERCPSYVDPKVKLLSLASKVFVELSGSVDEGAAACRDIIDRRQAAAPGEEYVGDGLSFRVSEEAQRADRC